MTRGSRRTYRRGDGIDPKRAYLSNRQVEILSLVAEGAIDNEIACRLCLSSTTVSHHMKRIRARLGLSSRAHAVALAVRLGILEHDPSQRGYT
jgi:DNA-binding CsgD family transcriptional regulator